MDNINKKYVVNNFVEIGNLVCSSMCYVNEIDVSSSVRHRLCLSCPLKFILDEVVIDVCDKPLIKEYEELDSSHYLDIINSFGYK